MFKISNSKLKFGVFQWSAFCLAYSMLQDRQITPGFIPHELFHKGIWLLSLKRPLWYYFMERNSEHTIRYRHFFESIDLPLKDLVNFLHCRGIPTTPSCAGHHKSSMNFHKTYDALENDGEEIRTSGLELQDIETGKTLLFKKEDYDLPWSRNDYVNQVMRYQQKGVFGIRAGKHIDLKERLLSLNLPGAKISEQDGIVFFHTDAHDGEPIPDKWKRITDAIKWVFHGR